MIETKQKLFIGLPENYTNRLEMEQIFDKLKAEKIFWAELQKEFEIILQGQKQDNYFHAYKLTELAANFTKNFIEKSIIDLKASVQSSWEAGFPFESINETTYDIKRNVYQKRCF